MRKVYAITEGRYSDYSVKVLCQTKKHAEQVLTALREGMDEFDIDDYNEIEEFPLLRAGELPKKVTRYYARVDNVMRHGTVPDITHVTVRKEWNFRQFSRIESKTHENMHGIFSVWAEGSDKRTVIKSVKDRVAALIATRTPEQHRAALERARQAGKEVPF